MAAMNSAIFAASSIFTLTQSIASASAQRAAGEAQKISFQINQRLANMQADDAIKRGDRAAGEHAQKVKKLIGAQRAALAGQGIDISIGSPLDIQAETAELGALDVLTIRNNAFREAWGLRVEAVDLSTRGAFASLEAKAKSRNTLLTGGLQTLNLASVYYNDFGLSSRGTSKTKTEPLVEGTF